MLPSGLCHPRGRQNGDMYIQGSEFIYPRVNPDGPGCKSLAPTHRAGPCGLTAYGINGSGDCDETLQPVIYWTG
jgi:hypothetical protein